MVMTMSFGQESGALVKSPQRDVLTLSLGAMDHPVEGVGKVLRYQYPFSVSSAMNLMKNFRTTRRVRMPTTPLPTLDQVWAQFRGMLDPLARAHPMTRRQGQGQSQVRASRAAADGTTTKPAAMSTTTTSLAEKSQSPKSRIWQPVPGIF